MITKAFEIRDSATFIPVIATQLRSNNSEDAYLIRRAGYSNSVTDPAVMITRLSDCKAGNAQFEWGNRTMQVAHQHIEDNFAELATGSVIDVQFILGERDKPKQSERFEVLG